MILNNDYEGGELAFFNGEYKLNPKKGDIVIFPSSLHIHIKFYQSHLELDMQSLHGLDNERFNTNDSGSHT